MEITLYRDEGGFAALQNEWNELLAASASNTIFLTWEWQHTWWHGLGQARGPLCLLAMRHQGRLAGIAPLYLSEQDGQRVLSVVGCVEVSDYLDLIVRVGREEAVYQAVLEWLAGPEAPEWDRLELCNQPPASLAHTLLPELARARGLRAEVLPEDVCPVVALPEDWDAYLAGLDKKQRHEVRRKLGRLERERPESRVRYVTGGPELPSEVECFVQLHRLSGGDKDDFMTPQMAAFFQSIARISAERGWLELSFLEIGDAPAAAMFCFDYGGEILLYNSGYDPGAYSQYSPGWVLLARVIQHAITRGRSRLDFLQGSEDYKYRFGGVDTQIYRTVVERG